MIVAFVILAVFVAGLAYALYDLLFKKNPAEVTNLEKKYVDPVLAEKQKSEAAVAAAEDHIKAGISQVEIKSDEIKTVLK